MLAKLLKLSLIAIILTTTQACGKKQIKKQPEQPPLQQAQQVITSELKGEFGNEDKIEEADVRKKLSASLKTVYFDFDKYDLTQTARDILSKNAKIIMENNLSIVIEGHCDERGTEQYNLSLGQKRANAVKDYYIRLGISPSKIATISYGEEMPVCTQQTEQCWALNRRAETKVSE